jgi:DNA-directed RNA polymerase subunit RPC12/RpoP
VARYIERSKYDWWGSTWKLLAFIALVVVAITVVYPWRGMFPTVLIVLLSLWLYIRLMTQRTGYKCANCGKIFQVPATVNFFTMSSVSKNPDGTYYASKSLTCPKCGKRTQARLLKRADEKTARGRGTFLK